MRAGQTVSIVLTMAMAAVASAEDFDGSVPLTCKAEKGHDCLPTETSCSPLKPETNIEPIYQIDFAKKEIHSPFRASLLKVQNQALNRDSLVLQGTEATAAWSAAGRPQDRRADRGPRGQPGGVCRIRPVQGVGGEITAED